MRRPLRALGAVVALAYLIWFTFVATTTMMVATGRILSPVAWWRLVRLSISLAFEVLADLVWSLGRDHHPDDRADPILLSAWLDLVDPGDRTVPMWPTGTGSPDGVLSPPRG